MQNSVELGKQIVKILEGVPKRTANAALAIAGALIQEAFIAAVSEEADRSHPRPQLS